MPSHSTKGVLHVGILRFPASNCDFDALNFFQRAGHNAEFIWYKDHIEKVYDLIVIPGGFAFGDRVYEKATHSYKIDPGVLAITSPVMKSVEKVAKMGIPIFGICNGFQILVKAGLLPGKLLQNASGTFYCDDVTCKVTGKSFFESNEMLGKTYTIPIAHGYGKYEVDESLYQTLKNNGQIFLEYVGNNPNGSVHNIAGVCNEKATIFGLMPHPERSKEKAVFMQAIEEYIENRKNGNILQAIREAMSSEHTSYASTKKYLRELPTKGLSVIQGPGENAGILDIGKGWALAMRIESHNHPSFIKPYHGAATGVGGILRDIFTMGARPIATLDILRFGTDEYAQKVFKGVVRGIADYGNCVGVPTVGGEIYFDATYNNNCLVNVAAVGLVKKENIIYGNALTSGNDLIYVGARTGRDGVGGAQMASENMNVKNEAAVQEADPFLEKLLLDACCELAQTPWIEGMQDMGAAGLLCSTSEVAIRGRKKTKKNLGAKIFLAKVPQKAENMTPIELLLSESQERMLIVGKRKYRDNILQLFKKWDLEARVIGEVTEDGKYTLVYEKDKKTITLAMDFDTIFPEFEKDWPLTIWKQQKTTYKKAPKESIDATWHQYDWRVGTRTLKGPNQPGHYAVLDIPEVGKELVIAWSSDEGIANTNPEKGILSAFDTCLTTLQKEKATPLGVTNCLNFGHPKDSMGAFVKTIEGLTKRCKATGIPVISGNVSLYNAYKDHSIKPTPVLVMVGLREPVVEARM